jgi:hypothetical protein
MFLSDPMTNPCGREHSGGLAVFVTANGPLLLGLKRLAKLRDLQAMARACDTLARDVPLPADAGVTLQRLKSPTAGEFSMLQRVIGKTVPVGAREELPGWSVCLASYAEATGEVLRSI